MQTCLPALSGSTNHRGSGKRGTNMSFGLTVFTFVHVVLSLVGICSGFVVVGGFFAA